MRTAYTAHMPNLPQEIATRPIRDEDVEATAELWARCELTRPWNDVNQDIAFARQGPASDVLGGFLGQALVAALMLGHDGHRGTIYYLGVEPTRRRTGIGRVMIGAAENWLRERSVWKTNLLVRADNRDAVRFYEALGYCDQACTVLGKRLDGRPDRSGPSE